MNVMKGAEPYSNVTDSPIGALVIHGFTGTAASMMPLARAFAEAGWNVELPRLTGHGTIWTDMLRVSYKTWIDDVDIAYKVLAKRCKTVFVAGLSMGASLALIMADKHPEIRGISIVNNANYVDSPLLPFLSVLKHVMKSVKAISNDIKKPGEKEIAYDVTPVAGVQQLNLLLKDMRDALPRITQPTLIFKSREDHVLPLDNATRTLEALGSKDKELVWLENSYHVATQDNDAPLIIERTQEFFNRLARGN